MKRSKMTVNEKKRVVAVCFIGTVMILLAALCIFFFRNGAMERLKAELRIRELSTRLEESERKIYVASHSMRAGEVLESKDVHRLDALKSYGVVAGEDCFGRFLLCDIDEGTEITYEILGENALFDADREVRFYGITLSDNTLEGDYVDVRIRLADGSDNVILSKKHVYALNLQRMTLDLHVKEEELELMNNASALAAAVNGTVIYTSKYISPGFQTASPVTYTKRTPDE